MTVVKKIVALGFIVLACVAVSRGTPLSEHANRLLDEVDQTIRKEFYDSKLRGVDWTAEVSRAHMRLAGTTSSGQMYEVIRALLGTLHTSHTALLTPDDPYYYFIGTTFRHGAPGYDRLFGRAGMQWADPGFLVEERADGVFVQSVFEDDIAAKAGLRVGDRIVDVDGRPWHATDSFRTSAGHGVTLHVQRTRQGPLRSVHLVPYMVDPQDVFIAADRASIHVIQQAGRRIGYVHLWAFSDPRVYSLFSEALHGKLLQTDAIVIDLRDGIGGDYPQLLYSLISNIPRVEFIGRNAYHYVMGGPFTKKIGVLINERSRSAKELYAYALRRLGATLVGMRTEGAVTAGRAFFMQDGSLLYVATAEVLIEGHSIEGIGVAPDIAVDRPIPYADGRDAQLDRVLAILTASTSAPPSSRLSRRRG